MPGKKDGDPYLLRLRGLPKPLRIVYGRPRTFFALAVGLASLLVLPSSARLASRLLIAWDIFAAIYMMLAFVTVITCDTAQIRRQAAIQDDGRFFILVMTGLGAFASIVAIVMELGIKPQQTPQLVLAVVTIVLSWAAIHTTFALHYAHDYYRGTKAGGLTFPGDDEPDYWDFVYFSFVIGMTAQVSDVGITDKIIRRTATAHGVISFIFNTALVALMVNIAASAILDPSGDDSDDSCRTFPACSDQRWRRRQRCAKRLEVAPAIVFLVMGIVLAFLPGFPRIEIKPEVVLLLILPPLIYSAGVAMSWREFRFNLRPDRPARLRLRGLHDLRGRRGRALSARLALGASALCSAPSSRRRTWWRRSPSRGGLACRTASSSSWKAKGWRTTRPR